MQLKVIPLLVVLMCFALIGIITIQYKWIERSLNESQLLIDSKVLQAVTNVDIQLSDARALAFFTEDKQTISKKDTFNFEFTDEHFIEQSLPHLQNHNQLKVEVLSQKKNKDDTLILTRTEIRKSENGVDCVQVNISDWREDLIHMREMEAVFKKISLEIDPQLADTRIDSSRIEKLLKHELNSFNLSGKIDWAIYDELENKFSINPSEIKFNYKIPLFKNDILHPNRYHLYLTLENKNQVIWSDIKSMILLSLLFILVIVSVFILSIRMVIKHKKISQIKTDFINNMTHEFKTPLATITLAADSISHPSNISDQNKVKEYLKIIKQEKNKLNQNVERILEVASMQNSKFNFETSAIDLSLVVKQAMKNLQLLMDDKKGVFQFESVSEPIVLGNDFYLENAIGNVIENAIKYCDKTPLIKVQILKNDASIVLHILDNGIGLTKRELEHVFDNFYRAESGDVHTTKGFGLGLTYTKYIVEKMGGLIYISSEFSKGTLVTIKLPAQ